MPIIVEKSYTILAAAFANEEGSAVIARTAEAGDVAFSRLDTPRDWADLMDWVEAGNAIQPFDPPPTPAPAAPPTVEQALAAAGYSLADLKTALGLA